MTRDATMVVWIPMELSTVGIFKEGPRTYGIEGYRLSDGQTILRCMLRPDLVYHRPNPMFHYWTMGVSDKWYGLTFHSLAEARIFDTAVHAVLEELQATPINPEKISCTQEVAVCTGTEQREANSEPAASVSQLSGAAMAISSSIVQLPTRSSYFVFSKPESFEEHVRQLTKQSGKFVAEKRRVETSDLEPTTSERKTTSKDGDSVSSDPGVFVRSAGTSGGTEPQSSAAVSQKPSIRVLGPSICMPLPTGRCKRADARLPLRSVRSESNLFASTRSTIALPTAAQAFDIQFVGQHRFFVPTAGSTWRYPLHPPASSASQVVMPIAQPKTVTSRGKCEQTTTSSRQRRWSASIASLFRTGSNGNGRKRQSERTAWSSCRKPLVAAELLHSAALQNRSGVPRVAQSSSGNLQQQPVTTIAKQPRSTSRDYVSIPLQPSMPRDLPSVALRTPSRRATMMSDSGTHSQPLRSMRRRRCIFCGNMFIIDGLRRRGECLQAPDWTSQLINRLSCAKPVRKLLIRCVAIEPEGNTLNQVFDNVFECEEPRASSTNCCKWVLICLLSFIVPCICCFWPLRGLRRALMCCHLCGGRHQAALYL